MCFLLFIVLLQILAKSRMIQIRRDRQKNELAFNKYHDTNSKYVKREIIYSHLSYYIFVDAGELLKDMFIFTPKIM